MATPLKVLIEKLNTSCRKATERAANICIAQGHYEVDMEHLWLALLEQPTNDFCAVLKKAKIDTGALQKDLQRELSTFKTGNQRTPVFSSRLPKLFENSWLIATLDSRTTRIRSGHLLLAALTEPELLQMTLRGSRLFEKVPVDELKHHYDKITQGSQEAGESPDLAQTSLAKDDAQPNAAGLSKTPALDQFTIDLTARAREGHIDPVIGRDTEIRQMIDILTRRRQNNPILTGEAGVGKTAVVEGLALKIAAGDVPPSLKPVVLRTLDLGLLQAGASVKGEFENRLKNVIDEVKKSPVPIVLFIDEAHTMIGAGGQAGQSDAANLLKPALARGELRTIAATTWSEYKQYFEKDAALARRFQVVKVDEPTEELAANMLRAMVPLMEKHFNVRILDEAVQAASRLSHRYISGRQLPDKAVSVLDTSCARVSLGRTATPAVIDDARQKLVRLGKEREAVRREVATGSDQKERLTALDAEIAALKNELEVNEKRFKEESDLVDKIQALRAELEAEQNEANPDQKTEAAASKRREAGDTTPELKAKQKALTALREELDKLQAGQPLILPHVDAQVIAEVISGWTGIPLGRMVDDEINTVLHLKDHLNERIIGQDHALDAIAQRVRTSRAGLEDPNKPKGVFLFVGPSGVGKTETALALADILYGGERKMVTINMSEYQEAHSVSGLKGSPPGYVGYGQGGVLTEAVRRQPYSVVLLDEVEKAHPDVLELFFQVFDKGQMDDAEGREIDFRNTLIILTSNVGSPTIMQECLSKEKKDRPLPDDLIKLLTPQLYQKFKPAFLGRLKTIPYYPIDDESLIRIIELKLGRIAERVHANHQAVFEWDQKLIDAVFARCTEVDTGARNVDHILNGTLLPEIAGEVLGRMSQDKPITRIKVSAGKNGNFTYKAS
ncbi:MAG: type VI secretion system ATPase TssH [Burkholderiales bacterium]|jgi:type VI secretion system protein VasG|nr:type VI secretion system ATPase TssH [Burkholderiales bacterium]